jgi:hypothetical protein
MTFSETGEQKREVTLIKDCNAIAPKKKRGGNSNLIDCNAIAQNIKGW